MISFVLASTLAALAAGTVPARPGISPLDVPGLVARYDADSMYERFRNGYEVELWEDASGNGHGLRATWDNLPPVFRTLQLNGKPTVAIREGNRFDVHAPFELGDHTIFLVQASEYTKRALFSSDTDERQGVMLWDEDGRAHLYQNGPLGETRYTRPGPLGREFGITVLGRESGRLKAFVNGIEVSSDAELATPLRVGRFFHVRNTTYVTTDGGGLRIAEMIFFDRYLADQERAEVTAFLAREYGIAVEDELPVRRVVESTAELAIDEAAVLVRLTSEDPANLNDDLVPLRWQADAPVQAPFRFAPDPADTEIHCIRDHVRIRVSVVVPLRAETAGPSLRGLILINGERYHHEETVSDPFEGAGATFESELRFQTTLKLEAGDFFEVLTSRAGAPGTVRIGPGAARIHVTRID